MSGIRFTMTFFCIVLLCYSCTRSDNNNTQKTIKPELSFNENPFGDWEIGYSKDTVINLSAFVLSAFPDTNRSIPLWHPAAGTGHNYPYIGQNRDSVFKLDGSERWGLRKMQIAMEASNSGQFAILRYHVPATGDYKLYSTFEGVHIGLSTTDVHILQNEKSLFTDVIDGYGGDTTLHAITGSHPAAVYENTIHLKKGDILTFAVGYGPNKNHYNDTTGLTISIEPI